MTKFTSLFLALLIACGPLLAKEKRWGEYVASQEKPGYCERALSALRKPIAYIGRVARGRNGPFILIATVGIALTIGAGTYLQMQNASRLAAKASRLAAKASVRALLKKPPTAAEEESYGPFAEDVASTEIKVLEFRTPDRESDTKRFVEHAKRDPFLWHKYKADTTPDKVPAMAVLRTMRAEFVLQAFQERRRIPLFENLGYDSTLWPQPTKNLGFFVLKNDVQRLLARPAVVEDRPLDYWKSVAEGLAELDALAIETESLVRRSYLTDSQGAEERLKLLAGPMDSEARKKAYLAALKNARPGQTVGDVLEQNGLKLFALTPDETLRQIYLSQEEDSK